MTTVTKAFKTELNPTREQIVWFRLCCRARRLTYNWLLGHYSDSYDSIDPQVDAALVALHNDPNDTVAAETLLNLTTIGLDESPIRQQRRNNKVRGRWPEADRRTDQLFHQQQESDPAVAVQRLVALKKLAKRWVQYKKKMDAWKALPADKRKNTPPPKKPKQYLRHFGLFKGNSWDNFLKSKWRSANQTDDKGKVTYRWWKQIPSSVIDCAVTDLKSAYDRWYKYLALSPAEKLTRPEVGPPKFKKARSNESFSMIMDSGGATVESARVNVTHGGWIKLKEKDYITVGRNKFRFTISHQGGKWFISMLDKYEPEQLPPGRRSFGVDVGIVDYAIIQPDNGPVERIANPNYREHGLGRQRMLNRLLDRKQGPKSTSKTHVQQKRGPKVGRLSKRWLKAKEKLNRHYYKMQCKHDNFQHEITTRLVRKNGFICVETLGIIDMIMRRPKRNRTKSTNRKLRRLIGGASWSKFRLQVEYKGAWYGTYVEKVSRWYPSTQECSVCQTITDVNWYDRKCRCPSCGLVIDMDDNAAANLLIQMHNKGKQATAAPVLVP